MEKDFCLGKSLGLHDGHIKVCPHSSDHHVSIRRTFRRRMADVCGRDRRSNTTTDRKCSNNTYNE